MRNVKLATLSAAMLSVPFSTSGANAQPAPSEARQLVGDGQLTDGEGHEGTWQVAATAQGNNLAGALIVNLAGRVLNLDLG